jgi:ribosome-associated toxin RatA of RatAB toxin-antitoxin module
MPHIKKVARVPHTPQQMYDLVNDVNKYHEFVPWCAESVILSRTEDEIRATLSFARSGFQKSFTTLNRLQPHKMVEIRLMVPFDN